MRGACTLGLVIVLTACAEPNAAWVDAEPAATGAPSPLAHPPAVAIDTTMQDGTPQAEFLLMQDLMREAGANAMLAGALIAMPAANDSVPDPVALPMAPMTTAPNSELGTDNTPRDSSRCARSMRVALAQGRGRVAVWWSQHSRNRVWLVAAWRDTLVAQHTLGAWRGPIVIDSLDHGPDGARAAEYGAAACARPAPSVVVDDALGYVHVAYALVGPEGPGVFYAHQMDPRAGFETPSAIVYGERMGSARVAASGNLVAVAYEDPNSASAKPRVGLAVSRTAGHSFEDRLIASGTSTIARDPYVVVRGRAVVEGWSELPSGAGTPSFRLRRAVVK